MLRLRAKGPARSRLCCAHWKAVPREIFAGAAYAELALRDVAIPLPLRPDHGSALAARADARLLARSPQPHHRILEIGSGSGYSTAVPARLGRDVVGVECFQRLALIARGRLEHLRISNVNLLWADGFEISPAIGLFDRILAHGALDRPPPNVLGALGEGECLSRRGNPTTRRRANSSVIAACTAIASRPRLSAPVGRKSCCAACSDSIKVNNRLISKVLMNPRSS